MKKEEINRNILSNMKSLQFAITGEITQEFITFGRSFLVTVRTNGSPGEYAQLNDEAWEKINKDMLYPTCDNCHKPIHGVFVGNGDGRVCQACWDKHQEVLKKSAEATKPEDPEDDENKA